MNPSRNELRIAPYLSSRYRWTPFAVRTRNNTLMMRLVDGFTLAQMQRYRIRLARADCDDLLRKFDRSIRDLHAEGIAHHDLHAKNIIYNPATREYALIDFGLAAPSLSPDADDADRVAEVRRRIRRLCPKKRVI